MRYAVTIALIAAAWAGSAQAREAESRNPFHCSLALQVAHALVREVQGPDGPLTKELHGRLVWQALAAARFPKGLDSDVEGDELRRQFTENREEGLEMAEACMKRQDAHPGFRAARIEKHIREGLPFEPSNARATMAQLQPIYRPEAAARR